METTAVYAGSFDPVTNGHLWMIERGAELFDRLIVAVGINPDKPYTYSLEQRLGWLRSISRRFGNVEVSHYENLFLARFAENVGAQFILRGIRNEEDYAYERTMRNVNADLHPGLTTVFLMPPREFCEISSSLVKGMVGTREWQAVVGQYVPADVLNDLAAAHP